MGAGGSQLGEAFVPIRATLDKLDGDLKEARSKVEGAMGGIAKIAQGVGQSVQNVGKILLGGLAGVGVAALGAAAGFAKLAADAEPLIGLQQGFAAVTARIGTSSQEMLGGLQAASSGLITNRDLMASFNKAAALVGDDFASRLPDAMSLVQKAAQATGQDMGYLFDSLVTGVGRVSPMILDNLGIQVQLSEVTERAAKMFGVQADKLTKTQQQAALTNIVMEKLNTTYGDVPNVAPTFAKFGVALKNLKDEIGLRLLPVMAPLAEQFLSLAQKVIPPLIDILASAVIPIVQTIADTFGKFFEALANGMDPILSIQVLVLNLAETFGMSESAAYNLALGVGDFIEKVQAAIASVIEFLTPIVQTITSFVSWNDILIALGIAIASVIIPAILGIIATLAPIIATIVLVVGAVSLLRHAWETDWGGIQEKAAAVWEWLKVAFANIKDWLEIAIPKAIQILSDFWTNTLQPAIAAVFNWLSTVLMPFIINTVVPWLKEYIPRAIQTLSDFWTTILWPAMQSVWSFIKNSLIPIFLDVVGWLAQNIPTAIEAARSVWDNVLGPALQRIWQFIKQYLWPAFLDVLGWLQDNIPVAIATAKDFWENKLKPALEAVWKFISESLWPAFLDIAEWLGTTIGTVIDTAAGFWKNTLQPALEDVWKFINEKLLPIFKDVGDYFDQTLNGLLDAIAKGWNGIREAVNYVVEAIKSTIEWIKKAIDAMPDWLIPGSPTPFEIGLRGIAKGFREIAGISGSMPLFGELGASMPAMAMAGAESPQAAGSTSYSSETTIYTNQDPLRVLHASRHLDKLGRVG